MPTAHRKRSRCGHQYRVSARNCPRSWAPPALPPRSNTASARVTGGAPVLRGLRQRRLKMDDVIEEYTQEILDNWDDSPP